ncbi:hypothetical protein HER32_03765 [Hymenobacter sp. BT18]|uniref:hypothetical protein n=1 Tax=Hymenobacter sp. BT18 TaxID=2835648 RepID=UPI00143EA565|nr:hypothetical protein [Hymenobacter sp. BT18]QIX60349.1 hypothetical protein HER32_03765 [Hymenobacter sp. BT18]
MNRKKPATFTLTSPNYFSMALFLGMGVFCFYHQLTPLAIGSVLLAVVAGTSAKTLTLDSHHRHYRVGSQLLGLNFGAWQVLPPTQRMVVRYFSDFIVSSGEGGGLEYDQDSRYTILLSVPGSQQAAIVTSTRKYDHAVRIGCFLGRALGVEVVGFNQHKQQKVLLEAESQDA